MVYNCRHRAANLLRVLGTPDIDLLSLAKNLKIRRVIQTRNTHYSLYVAKMRTQIVKLLSDHVTYLLRNARAQHMINTLS